MTVPERPERPERPLRYTFLLSLWRENTSAPWRATLRTAGDETRRGFTSLEQLAAYLRQVTAEQARIVPANDSDE